MSETESVSGSTWIALHGFTGSPGSWRTLLPHAFCPWLGGHGPAPDCSASFFEEEVGRLARLLRERPAPRRLVGYSMGARVGLALLILEPELFEEAVLIGVNPGLEEDRIRAERRAWEQSWARLIEEHGVDAFVDGWSRLPIFTSQNLLSPEQRREQDRIRRAHTAGGLCHALGVLGLADMPSYWARLHEIQIPVRLITGELDEKFSDLAGRMSLRMPQARVERLPGVGHNPLVEAPEALRSRLGSS